LNLYNQDGRTRVEEWIRSRGLRWRIIEMPVETRTVGEAARALGVSRSSIAKTIIVICGDAVIAAIVPGDRRLDLNKLSKIAIGCRLASPEQVRSITGFPAGGVPPIGLPRHVTVVMDGRLLGVDIAYGGGGGENLLLEFSPRELASLGLVIVADVSS
jgi:prolyl-tRNA editing enzyme YbaK/EbsC (Cys-tRNA(Pro) deacylase)